MVVKSSSNASQELDQEAATLENESESTIAAEEGVVAEQENNCAQDTSLPVPSSMMSSSNEPPPAQSEIPSEISKEGDGAMKEESK